MIKLTEGDKSMSKILTAYFSASGVTKRIAERLAAEIKSDIFEIKPAVPYTQKDLDWTNSKSRSSLEMKDKTFRPQIEKSIDTSGYDVVFVGFPIWWYVAPTIVNTFLESCNLKGKKVIPFATSGGSGMGNTVKELIPSCKGATVCEGRRFSANASAKEIGDWAKKQL